MTPEDFEEALKETVAYQFDARETTVAFVRSYEEVGMLTYDRGLVVTLDDGSEYQVTIVKSK